jgi:hypothetical protein
LNHLQWGTQFSSLQKPKQKPDLVLDGKNSNFAVFWELYISIASINPTLTV